MPEKEDVMKGIILAAVIIAVCRAVKILMKRELKKSVDTDDNNFKGAVGACTFRTSYSICRHHSWCRMCSFR